MGPCGELHKCPACKSPLVQPERWEKVGDSGSCWIWRRCPECGWTGNRVHHEAEVEAYEEELDRELYLLQDAANAMDLDAMREMAALFCRALEEGLITADDFGVPPVILERRSSTSRYALDQ